ncbi:hypothetical protein [Pseudochryseolinea flava]|uniref:Outer membrane protein beta-barrel domain-containing protein n=1 Tax=Pseudochryseolinea flava TaxID=2059302 RepID=A0A364Y2W0_9BACT|nr:hypothetical protein [Pseudochryseolinea flava]RAW01225.1 hypothetical protein DQQ10_09945 [Pseudochryseolinea flava]
MKVKSLMVFLLCLLPFVLYAQVGEIKDLSSGTAKGESSGSSSNAGAFGLEIAFYSIQWLEVWQREVLKKRVENENLVSLECYVQSGIQPSSYYIVQPRIRGNWGVFSTDFRFNYLIEEGVDGVEYLRTDDWQILQLNVITANNVTFRVGGGIIHEDFSGGNTYQEWTAGLQLQSDHRKLGGVIEYRTSLPRKEFSAHLQFRLGGTERFHVYGTGGAVYQRYYKTVNVWGMQAGLMFRIN